MDDDFMIQEKEEYQKHYSPDGERIEYLMENPMNEKTCRFGHICTSGCQKDFDCPCQSSHYCALTENCEGPAHCDDHYVETKT